jgi:hypothetical protein
MVEAQVANSTSANPVITFSLDRVDLDALHAANPDVAWQSFADWAQHTFESRSQRRREQG